MDAAPRLRINPMPVIDPAILLDEFTEAAADRLLAVAGHGSGSPLVIVEVRQLGGAYAREGRHPSAFAHRAAGFSVLAVGMADVPGSRERADQVFAALSTWDTGGVWPNFGPAHDMLSALRAYPAETLARLVEIAHRYDPDGVLQIGGFTRLFHDASDAA